MTVTSPYVTLDVADIEIGDELPVWEVPVSSSLIVAAAIASRDFMPVHHDRSFAQGQGSPDIFMNILTDNGLCTRYLTDWAGPEAMLKKLSIRLGVPAFPGSVLTFTGSVTDRTVDDRGGTVEVSFRGTNELGDHVSGTAVLAFERTEA